MVNHDTNTTRSLPANTGLLELSKGESTTLTDLDVVADSLSTDGGAEGGDGADTESSGLGLTGLTTAKLAAGLVEPGLDSALPVLAEMVVVEN